MFEIYIASVLIKCDDYYAKEYSSLNTHHNFNCVITMIN